MNNMFYGCYSLKNVDCSFFDTTNVKDMSCMFGKCKSLTSLDLNNFNTDNVEKMFEIFGSCPNLEFLDIRNFNTSNINNDSRLFFNLKENGTIYFNSDKFNKSFFLNNTLETWKKYDVI